MEHRGRFLLNRHALRLHRLRQRGERAGDPVLHQHLREVDVHADLERHGQRVAAVGRAERLHVDHAVDAVDLLLDRQRHGIDHVARAGAGIAGRHRDRRRHHIGILRHRQREQRHAADHDHEDGEHIRQNRTLDEEFRDHGARYFEPDWPAAAGSIARIGAAAADRPSDPGWHLDAGHHDAFVRLQAALDRTHLAEGLAELHPALLDDIVGIEREHVAAALVAAHRHFRNQQRRLPRMGTRTRTK